MPVYEYKCDGECGQTVHKELSADQYRESFDCQYWFDTMDLEDGGQLYPCEGKLKRVFSFALRPVPGAGGSPGRY